MTSTFAPWKRDAAICRSIIQDVSFARRLHISECSATREPQLKSQCTAIIRNDHVYGSGYERVVFRHVDAMLTAPLRHTLLKNTVAQSSFIKPWQTASNTTTSLGIDDEV